MNLLKRSTRRIGRFIKHLARDVLRWGPAARVESLPETQQEQVFDEHWRNG